ncbi:MAG: hypothetical protein KAV82_16085, partial [Phycisphaerae bacterium]|nr:hypothetical protein [Phycisphaerae bacterium]
RKRAAPNMVKGHPPRHAKKAGGTRPTHPHVHTTTMSPIFHFPFSIFSILHSQFSILHFPLSAR